MIPLTRSLIVLDLETTSADPKSARIVEIGFLLIKPDGSEHPWSSFVNPLMPIPEEATKIHGITNAMVADAPTWSTHAERMAKGFTNVDFAGYNVRFDLQVLEAEFKRCDLDWSHSGAVIDGFRLWQVLEPRTLSDAIHHFLGERHDGAHRAGADVAKTWQLIKAQIHRLEERTEAQIPWPFASVAALHQLLWPRPANAVDAAGKIIWINNVACLGPWSKKHGNKPLSEVPKDYLRWIAENDFPADVKRIVLDARQGLYPTRAA